MVRAGTYQAAALRRSVDPDGVAAMYFWRYESACRCIVQHTLMARSTTILMPAAQRHLSRLGQNIRLARLRRGFSMKLTAERAGMTRATLYAIERGKPTVSIGAYVNALHVLGLSADLAAVAEDDELGRKLQDARLETSRRSPPKRTG